MIKLIFFLIFIAPPFVFATNTISNCKEALSPSEFQNISYAFLSTESPLTEQEALSLFESIHTFSQQKFGVSADKKTFLLFAKNKSHSLYKAKGHDYVFIDEEPSLMALPEIQKLMAWYQETNELALAHLEGDDAYKSEDKKVYLEDVTLDTGRIIQNPHSDSVYARVLMTALGPSTEIIDQNQMTSAERGRSILISGYQRSYYQGTLATTHQSPDEIIRKRLFIKLTYNHKDKKERRGIETGILPMPSDKLTPTFQKDGFQFFNDVINLTEDEVHLLNDQLKEALKNLNLKKKDFNLNLGSLGGINSDVSKMSIYNSFLSEYFKTKKSEVLSKLKSQTEHIISQYKKYFFDGTNCSQVQATLRVGFKKVPLYSEDAKVKSVEVSRFHTDGVHSRVLIPLLGSRTEVYSRNHQVRVLAPMRQMTTIAGTLANKENATLHRAPDMKAEDRLLVVISCYKKTKARWF